VGAGSPEDKAVVYHFVKNADTAFVRWCLNAIINWKRSERLPGIIHLHGEKDHLLPLRYTKPDFVIKKGGHLMVLNRAKEVNEILNEILSKN
jgi:hypothetical protein